MLFLSQTQFGFGDAIRQSQAGRAVLPHANWGTGLIDLDNDSDRDIFICNGHFLRHIHDIDPGTEFKVANCVMENLGGTRFRSLPGLDPTKPDQVESSRGAAFDDLDNDGDIDVIVLNAAAPAQVLENDSNAGRHWLEVQLVGTAENRDAVGARVLVTTGTTTQLAVVHSGRSYQSHYGSRLHFGLGDSRQVDSIEVSWSGAFVSAESNVTVLNDLAADQVVTIVQ